jgi:hypothetical protein
MSKKIYYSRAHYVLAHAFVQQYFESFPNLAFLQDSRNERKYFQRYLQWGPLSQNWTYWQKSLLYNLYERKRGLKKTQKIFGNLTSWGMLLKFYLYSSENPVTLSSFLKGHPFLCTERRSQYIHVAAQGYLPEFKIVLAKCHESVVTQSVNPLLFSGAQKIRDMDRGLKEQLQTDHQRLLDREKAFIDS